MKHNRLKLSVSAAVGASMVWGGLAAVTHAQVAAPPPLIQPEISPANAQGVTLGPDLPDTIDELPLGQAYESLTAAVAFCPPVDCKLVDSMNSNYVAEWADTRRDWTLKLGKMVLDSKTPLVNTKDFDPEKGKGAEGVLEKTIKNLKAQLPGGVILRKDLTNTRDGGHGDPEHPNLLLDNVALIAIRYTFEGRHRLSQQAIIQTPGGLYYLLTLTTPGANDDKTVDHGELVAVNTFARMIDSVRMLDRKAIKEDQDNRLFHTRASIINWTPEKLHRLIGQQWLRIIKNGKDIGYTYITEDIAGGIPRPLKRDELEKAQANGDRDAERRNAPHGDGILIGSRTRMIIESVRSDKTRGPIQTDTANWFFVTLDKKHEDFSRVVVTDDHIAPKKGYVQEFGVSNNRVGRVMVPVPPDPNANPNAINPNPNEKMLAFKEDWELDVSQTSNVGMAPPLVRKLPPWYVPQALAHLLPRLLPLNKPQGYVFAVYVSDAGEVVMRYIDVMPEETVQFAGQVFRAVPVRDRLGLEGSVTTHYMSMDGVYLGSENKEQKLVMQPTDELTLKHIWTDINIPRPGVVERPAAAATDAGVPR